MIIAVFHEGETKTYTKSIFQYDKGQRLGFEGIEYPKGCEVHFSNKSEGGLSYAAKMTGESAKIPDAFLETGDYIYAWLYAKEKSTGTKGEIDYHLDNDPTDPTPDDNLVIDKTSASKKGYDNSQTLYEVIIPVIRRPNIFRYEDEESSEQGEDTPEDMKYSIENEDLSIDSLGNDGNGNPSTNSYEVNGENFIFTKPN